MAEDNQTGFILPKPVYKQNFDWLQLSSKEWLKGDIVSMYGEKLEFDSEELGKQVVDWSEVHELRSKSWQSIRLNDGTVIEGYLVVENGNVSLHNQGVVSTYSLNDILSIAASSQNKSDLWDGYANLGFNLRRGNTAQLDYTFKIGAQRRSASARFHIDYIANYSKFEDQTSDEEKVTANRHRLSSTYDWFFDPNIYFRAADFELLSDEFLNINYRVRYGVAIGYQVLETGAISWGVNVGPSYQLTQYDDVVSNDSNSDKSAGLTLGTEINYEINSDIDYEFSYSVQIVNEDSGQYIHHLETGLKVNLSSDFNLDLMFYADRTEKPKADGAGNFPEQNDYRLVVSLGYTF